MIVLLHLLAALWLATRREIENAADSAGNALLITFIEEPPLPEVRPAPAQQPASTRRSKVKRARGSPEIASGLQQSPPGPEHPLELYDPDGSLRTPDDMLEQIDRQVGDQRVFSYQIPHMDDAKKYFYRNQALTYESTQFEQYWKPDQDMLTELLTKLVEATTKEIKISIPGDPRSKVICKISILALGGGCGLLTSGADYVGPVDDPDTLNPEEDRQCQAWWDQIIGAKTQELWRKTRQLYEAQCRKPLARHP